MVCYIFSSTISLFILIGIGVASNLLTHCIIDKKKSLKNTKSRKRLVKICDFQSILTNKKRVVKYVLRAFFKLKM